MAIVLESIQSVIDKLLKTAGLVRDDLSLRSVLKRCLRRGLDIGTVIDIGASNGVWSLKARMFFPDASFFLVEAQRAHESKLSRLKSKKKWIDYIISAAGNRIGEIYFDDSSLFGGIASDTPFHEKSTMVPVVTIDSVVAEKGLKPPFLLKLDTHGFEVPIFEGAKETLKHTRLIIVETYNFKLTPDSLRFHGMCSYLEACGFRCIDLCEPMHRPKDGALWQMDLFFVPADRKEFRSNTYE